MTDKKNVQCSPVRPARELLTIGVLLLVTGCKPATYPAVQPVIEEQVTCSVTRTECTGWSEDDINPLAGTEINCPPGNITSQALTPTICFATTAMTQATDAQSACNDFCQGDPISGLYPLGNLVGKPMSNVNCSAHVQGFLPALPGQCEPTPGPSNGASERVTCSLAGRECNNITPTLDQSETYCAQSPEITQSESGCFDPTTTTAQLFCEHAEQFKNPTSGQPNIPDIFPWWNVATVTPNGCTVPAPVGLVATGIGEGNIGSFVIHGITAPLVAKGGFATTETQCDPDNEFCSTILETLRVQLADITVSGLTLHNPQIQLAAPVASQFGVIAPNTMFLAIDADITAIGHVATVFSPAQALVISNTGTSISLAGNISGTANLSLQTEVSFGATLSLTSSTTSPNAQCGSETSQQQLLGFETLSDWTSAQVPLALTPDLKTQGCFGLEVGGSGYRTLNSAQFGTPMAGTTGKLALDLFIPSGQPNPNYFGAVQMYLSCPSASFNNQFIGQVDLTGLPVGKFSTLNYQIPSAVLNVLTGAHPDCFFSVTVNMNQTPDEPVLDNLRFK
jgi:hypothetical protein